MIVPYRFTYLVAGLIHFFVWLILYWHRKDIRKEMWIISILVMIVSVIAEYYMWTVDYWYPPHAFGGGALRG